MIRFPTKRSRYLPLIAKSNLLESLLGDHQTKVFRIIKQLMAKMNDDTRSYSTFIIVFMYF